MARDDASRQGTNAVGAGEIRLLMPVGDGHPDLRFNRTQEVGGFESA